MQFSRKNIQFKVAIAFLLLVMLPFGIGVVYLNMDYRNQIYARWIEESNAGLISMQDEVNTIHISLNSMLIQLQQDDTFSPHRLWQNSYHTMLAMEQLRRYVATNSALHMLAYVDGSQARILTNVSSDGPEHFALRFFEIYEEGHYDFWNKIRNNNGDAVSEPLMVLPSAVTQGNILVYVANFRVTQLFDSPQFLIMLDASVIESQLTSNLPTAASLLITNNENLVLLSGGALPSSVAARSTIASYEIEQLALQYNYAVTHYVAANGWHYYMLLPTSSLLYEIRGVTQMYIIFGLAFVVASILFFIIYYKYNGAIQRQLDASYLIRRKYFLHQLLAGSLNEGDGLKQAQSLTLNLEHMHYTVVLLFAAQGEYTVSSAKVENFLNDYLPANRLGFLVENVLEEVQTILLTLPFKDQEVHKLEVVRIQAMLSEECNIRTIACIGSSYSSIGDIRLSFQEAVRTSRYRYSANKNNCITFSDTGEDSAFSRSYPTKEVQSFYKALAQGSKEVILDRIREISRLMDGFTISLCRCIYCDLSFGIFHHFQAQNPVPPLSTELLDNINNMLETQEMREIKRLMELLEKSFLDISDKDRSLNLVDRVRQYIDDHFHESSLSIVEIADNLDISAGHLSRSYKKESGETLLNYINNKRIEKAKNLLIDTDKPLQEIVRAIGYLDVSSFYRKFKSTEGLTPGAYREQYK